MRIFCYPENKTIYELIFSEYEFTVISKRDIYINRFFNFKAREELHSFNPDILVDLTGTILSASLIIGSKGKIYGLTQNTFNLIFTRWVTKRKVPHLIDVYFDALSTFMEVTEHLSEKTFKVADNTGTCILIHPGAGWAAKEWGNDKFLELSNKLQNLGYQCGIITDEASVLSFTDAAFKDKFMMTNNLKELVINIQNCSAFIGNDSGPLYIANLLGKPTFSIYGPTNPRFSLPYGEQHSFIQKKIKCIPQYDEQYCYTDAGRNGCISFDCMKQLTVDETVITVLDFLRKNNIRPNA